MFSSIANVILGSLSDMTQNPVSITIFGILSLLIVALAIAIFSPLTRDVLIRIKILEEDEEPSSLLLWIIGIIIVVKLVQAFLIQPFIVDGASMLPTYHNQEFLLVDKLSYHLHVPARGDIMIFKLYENINNPYEGKHLIKRVIGLPDERVVVKNGITTIYNKSNPGGFILDEPYVEYKDTQKEVDVTLDDHHYFVMGDNRSGSFDSRGWGPLPKENIDGRALLRLWPLSSIDYLPAHESYDTN